MTGCCCRGHRPIATSRCSTTPSGSTSPGMMSGSTWPSASVPTAASEHPGPPPAEHLLREVPAPGQGARTRWRRRVLEDDLRLHLQVPSHQTGAERLKPPTGRRRRTRSCVRKRGGSSPAAGTPDRRRSDGSPPRSGKRNMITRWGTKSPSYTSVSPPVLRILAAVSRDEIADVRSVGLKGLRSHGCRGRQRDRCSSLG